MTIRGQRASPLGAAIDVPHLSPEEAWLVARLLRRLAKNIWDAFGDDLLVPPSKPTHGPDAPIDEDAPA